MNTGIKMVPSSFADARSLSAFLSHSSKERGILPVLHDFSDKRVLFASVPRCKVQLRATKESPVVMAPEGPDRDAAHEAAMKWIDDLNQHGPLRIKQIVVVERDRKWIATVTYTEGE